MCVCMCGDYVLAWKDGQRVSFVRDDGSVISMCFCTFTSLPRVSQPMLVAAKHQMYESAYIKHIHRDGCITSTLHHAR